MLHASPAVNRQVSAISDEELIELLGVPARNAGVFTAAAAELVRRLDALPPSGRVDLHARRVARRVSMPAVRMPG